MKLLLFTDHQGDLLAKVIQAVTRGQYVHAGILIEPDDFGCLDANFSETNIGIAQALREGSFLLWESYWPHVRYRTLKPGELAGIHAFEIAGITPTQQQMVLHYCAIAVAIHQRYSILGLLRFSPFLRWILGEGDKDGLERPAFCSQAAFEAIRHCGIKLLHAHSECVNPEILSYSPLLNFLGALADLQASGKTTAKTIST